MYNLRRTTFFTAHVFLQCSAVVGLYFLLSALKREIGVFRGMVSGISFSLTFLPKLGRTRGNTLGFSVRRGRLTPGILSRDERLTLGDRVETRGKFWTGGSSPGFSSDWLSVVHLVA